MCLNPRLIINPAYYKNPNRFVYVYIRGRQILYQQTPFSSFDFEEFNFRKWGVTPENAKDCYAVDMTGDITPLYIETPCNKCLECANKKRKELHNRMLIEQIAHGDVRPLFCTLTYNNESLPLDLNVSSEDLKYFFKRLHINLERGGFSSYFRHIFFSEYCPSTGRPHYHGILYGIQCQGKEFFRVLEIIEKSWSKGFVKVKHFMPWGFGYVSKYCLKKSEVPPGRIPNFWTGSRRDGGIGFPALSNPDFEYAVLSSDNFTFKYKILGNVYTIHLPRYLRDKIFPRFRSFIPLEVERAIKNLLFNQAILKAREFQGLTEIKAPEIPHDFIEKFPFYEYLFDHTDITSWFTKQYHSIIFNTDYYPDEEFLTNFYNDSYYLDNFIVDIDKIYRQEFINEKFMIPYIQNALRYLASQPSADDRALILQHQYNSVKNRCHSLI